MAKLCRKGCAGVGQLIHLLPVQLIDTSLCTPEERRRVPRRRLVCDACLRQHPKYWCATHQCRKQLCYVSSDEQRALHREGQVSFDAFCPKCVAEELDRVGDERVAMIYDHLIMTDLDLVNKFFHERPFGVPPRATPAQIVVYNMLANHTLRKMSFKEVVDFVCGNT